MSDAPEKQQAAAGASTSAAELNETAKVAPGSPARSDKSSDSEGKNVREKFKDTQIDAHATSDPVPSSDQAMKDAPNGTAKVGEQSASGSDTERGRLRRKRSHEDFEEDTEAAKLPGKKADGHKRKRSRDITKDIETFVPSKPVSPTIAEEDEQMTSPSKNTATTTTTDKASGIDTSPKNKRTRDQIEKDAEVTAEGSEAASANGKPVEKAGDERDTKRLRDKEGAQSATGTTQSKTKVKFRFTYVSPDLTPLSLDNTRKWIHKHLRSIAFHRYGIDGIQASSIEDL
jgi:Ran-binding protein 3